MFQHTTGCRAARSLTNVAADVRPRVPLTTTGTTKMTEYEPLHTCEGLEKLKDAGGGCVPSLSFYRGVVIITGCDDENPVPLLFCPMCGVPFKEAE